MSQFPTPRNIRSVRQFLGLASYYRRFVRGFARVASPLHYLTRKDARWPQCELAFQKLKSILTAAPILAYPNFDKDYVLETDASVLGLGAVLSQEQIDRHLHPVAYASRALTPPERNYGITELETLAVVWAISHYHRLLYGMSVTVYTDHTSVKAVIQPHSKTRSVVDPCLWARCKGCQDSVSGRQRECKRSCPVPQHISTTPSNRYC